MFTARSTSRGKVFIVDDNKAMSLLLSNILSKYFQVLAFSNALQAFAHLKYKEVPDILITDYRMPEMDGFELIKNIRNNGLLPGLPIFMVTGATPSEIPTDLHIYDIKAVIQKPFEPKLLVEKMINELDVVAI